MRITERRTSLPMTAATYTERARGWAKLLEDRESARSGLPLTKAREAVARQISVPQGTLENLRKNRLKAIAAHWYNQLHAGVLRALEAELRHVEFELQVARQQGLSPGSSDYQSALANRERLRQALGLSASDNGGDHG